MYVVPYLVLLLTCLAWAEQLPMVVLSAPDGFAAGTVPRIVADSRGIVWFPHAEGLTRYNGNSFRSFIKANGLPTNRVSDIVERPMALTGLPLRTICAFSIRARGSNGS